MVLHAPCHVLLARKFNWTPGNCREKKRGCGCRQTHRRRLLPERNKFVYNRSAQGLQHLCCTALVSVKPNQFDFHQVQPMHLHPFISRSTFLEKKGRGEPNWQHESKLCYLTPAGFHRLHEHCFWFIAICSRTGQRTKVPSKRKLPHENHPLQQFT